MKEKCKKTTNEKQTKTERSKGNRSYRPKITVRHWAMSDQNQKLSDQTKNTPDILSERKNLRQN